MTTGDIAPHIVVGKAGEDHAAQFLQTNGYRILDRNVRSGKHDEIDVIAVDPKDNVLAFIEVKTRSHAGDDYVPSLNLTREKRMRMFRAARRWMTTHNYDGGYRFDLIGIAGETIVEHILDVRVRDERRRPKRSWQVVPW
ncbi:YraN family protein [Candidatus Peregrinibacteria bacterium]|nr:YraN family protein [Candidatus Peregrinibacteria bacterium]